MIEKTKTLPAPCDKTTWWTEPVSACVGGMSGALICFPFEGLKKRLQTGQKISFHPRELYRGAPAFSISVMSASGTSMTVNSLIHKYSKEKNHSNTWEMLAAIVSGVCGAIVGSTPVENTILVQQKQKSNPIKAMNYMLSQKPSRPWLGLPELAAREAGFSLVMLWGAESAEKFAWEKTNNKVLAETAALLVAVVGSILTQPFDTLASYRQDELLVKNRTVSSRTAFRELITQGGIRRLLKGCEQRILLFTGCAFTIPKIRGVVRDYLSN